MLPDAAVIAVEKSGNHKIGIVSATYASQASCPQCPLMDNGCYAESGMVAFVTRRLNRSALTDVDAISEQEAQAIRSLTGKLPLRVHVVGDCTTDTAARNVSGAMLDHTAKHGQPAWTYTHAWRDVDAASWQGANVLASCESPADVREARGKGYATAIVVEHFPGPKRFDLDGEGVIPCPQQTGKAATCADCGLCMNAKGLRDRKLTIGFAVHGARKSAATAAIQARS